MGLMGFKFTSAREYEGERFSQMDLSAFRHPGLPPDTFWKLQYGADEDAWEYLNTHLKDERLLTHENRHYVLDPTITLVHLDDWDIQKTYTMRSDRAKMALFRELGIRYYLYVPNEDKHTVNRRVGLEAWKGTPLMKEVRRWGENVLYEFRWEAAGLPPTPPLKPRALESCIPRHQWMGEKP